MNKQIITLSLSLILLCGCSAKDNRQILVKINNYKITQAEFDAEFRASPMGRVDTPESRQDFLNNLISRKLVLQEAQAKGLDKNKDFLKLIERFWEQSLLKTALDRKTQEIASTVKVSDQEIANAYQQLSRLGKADKPYSQMYNELKWQILRAKETQIMNEWLDMLRTNAKVQINYNLLKSK